ncbi:MAG: radical SAM protein [Bacteroidota bacterium]|nr:radical SAM protein [Bacteroidota bacterium]MDP4230941.1 radical SAM protein [Bacteroidota bacterium]MDP4237679.1 radical SAM protein [Bacteroidota bacterium]
MNIDLPLLVNKISNTSVRELPQKVGRGVRHWVMEYPVHIIVQTVTACNLACEHCFITNYGKEIPDAKTNIMNWDLFVKLLDRIKPAVEHAEYFQFSTFEELLHKRLFDMMDLVLKINPKIEFPIHSNTMLLDDEKLAKLATYPISELTISLDGMNKDTVERFKTGAQFEKIIETLQKAVALPWKARVGVVFVAHRNNIAELPDYVDFVHNMGINTIYVNNLLSFTPQFHNMYLYSKTGNPEAEQIFKEAIARVERLGMTIYIPRLTPEPMGCSIVEAVYIDCHGNVSPCDFLAESTPFELFGETKQGTPVRFGNVMEENILDIYRSAVVREFRNKHRHAEVPEPCTHCIDAYGLMCSKRTKYGA